MNISNFTKFSLNIIITVVIILTIGCNNKSNKKMIIPTKSVKQIIKASEDRIYQIIIRIEGNIIFTITEDGKNFKKVQLNIGRIEAGTGFPATKYHILTNKHVVSYEDSIKTTISEFDKILKTTTKNRSKIVDINVENIYISAIIKNKTFDKAVEILPKCSIENIPKDIFIIAKDKDIAIIKVKSKIPNLVTPFKLSTKEESAGTSVIAMGYPGRIIKETENKKELEIFYGEDCKNLSISVDEGKIMQIRPIKYENTGYCYIHNATTNHGMSGGPLFNRSGKVIGINTLNLEFGEQKSSKTFASVIINEVKETFPDFWNEEIKKSKKK